VPMLAAALRLGGDVAVVHVPDGAGLRASAGVALLARNSASGLAVVRLPGDPAPSAATPRTAQPLATPQYLIATTVYPDGVAIRPAFVAATARVDAPLWAAAAYAVPAQTDVSPGAFLFTRSGEFAGLAIDLNGAPAFVPGDTVLDEANRLIATPAVPRPDYGIHVHDLSPALGRALSAEQGVVVAWVDPAGPAREALSPRDVIETVGGQPVPTSAHWRRHVATHRTDGPVTMSIRRAGVSRSVTVTPLAVVRLDADDEGHSGPRRPFGAVFRLVPGAGSEVVTVETGSPAARAGLVPGDTVIAFGDVSAPSPAQINRAASPQDGKPVVMMVRRNQEHRLLVVEP
jgi:hypothetical protein